MLRLRPRDLPGLHDLRSRGHSLPGSREHSGEDRSAASGNPPSRYFAHTLGADRHLRVDRRSTSASTSWSSSSADRSTGQGTGSMSTASSSDAVDSSAGHRRRRREWWRLITAAFLHYGILHLGLNMLVLWIIGPPLEEYFGHGRYLLVYLVSGLAGSAGALLWSPDVLTVGASGAIWGIMGAALVLEGRKIYVLGGQAMGLVIFNLADHVPDPRDLDRRARRRADRRRALRACLLEPATDAGAGDAVRRSRGCGERGAGCLASSAVVRPRLQQTVASVV